MPAVSYWSRTYTAAAAIVRREIDAPRGGNSRVDPNTRTKNTYAANRVSNDGADADSRAAVGKGSLFILVVLSKHQVGVGLCNKAEE